MLFLTMHGTQRMWSFDVSILTSMLKGAPPLPFRENFFMKITFLVLTFVDVIHFHNYAS